MMDMVRKHCVEGSGNYKAAQACVDRTHEMLRMFKQATTTFVCSVSYSQLANFKRLVAGLADPCDAGAFPTDC